MTSLNLFDLFKKSSGVTLYAAVMSENLQVIRSLPYPPDRNFVFLADLIIVQDESGLLRVVKDRYGESNIYVSESYAEMLISMHQDPAMFKKIFELPIVNETVIGA